MRHGATMIEIRRLLHSIPFYVKIRRYGLMNTIKRMYYRQRIKSLCYSDLVPQGMVAPCEIHLLTSAWDWDLALWAVGSFYHWTQVDWPLVVHDGGGMRPEWFAIFKKLFPNCRVIHAVEADFFVNSFLTNKGLSATIHARTNYNLMRKVIDTAVACQSDRYILLDSDVLFFRQPNQILDLVKSKNDRIHLLRDYQDSYSIDSETANHELKMILPPLINTGLAVIPRNTIDFDAMEGIFSKGVLPLNKDGFAEQTLLALLAGRNGYDYFPCDYEVVTKPLVSYDMAGTFRHYVGPVKKLFFDEGVPLYINSRLNKFVAE